MTLSAPSLAGCAGALLFISACAGLSETAPEQTAALTDQQAAEENMDGAEYDDGDPNEMICKKRPPLTGSRIGSHKDCRTREQWRRSAGNANRAINSMINDKSNVPQGN